MLLAVNAHDTLQRLLIERALETGQLYRQCAKMDALLDGLLVEGLDHIQQVQRQTLAVIQSPEFSDTLTQALASGLGGALIRDVLRQAHAATAQFHEKAPDDRIWGAKQLAFRANLMGRGAFERLNALGDQLAEQALEHEKGLHPKQIATAAMALIRQTTHSLQDDLENQRQSLVSQIDQARLLGGVMDPYLEGNITLRKKIADVLMKHAFPERTGTIATPPSNLAQAVAMVLKSAAHLESDLEQTPFFVEYLRAEATRARRSRP